jgi:hypothetical protein
LAVQKNDLTIFKFLAAPAVEVKQAPAARFVRFDYIEFDGWADSMGKRNLALSSRAGLALVDSGPQEGIKRVANHCVL